MYLRHAVVGRRNTTTASDGRTDHTGARRRPTDCERHLMHGGFPLSFTLIIKQCLLINNEKEIQVPIYLAVSYSRS